MIYDISEAMHCTLRVNAMLLVHLLGGLNLVNVNAKKYKNLSILSINIQTPKKPSNLHQINTQFWYNKT